LATEWERAAAADARGWPEAAARHRAKAAAAAERKPPSGAATANGSMRALRALWNFTAERVPDLPANPVRRLKRQWFPVPRRERPVRADELPAFYGAVQALLNPVARDYLLLLLFTGLRRREAASLRWDDVDFALRVIRLPAARTKAGRRLDLPMVDVVRDMLVARRALGKETFVFPANSRAGHIVEPKFPLDLVAKATGVRVSVHDLRRTFITAAESADISPIALKALVNHSLGGDVTSGYIQMTAERLRDPAQRVADKMKALCGIAPVDGGNVARSPSNSRSA
jgi:integrase